VRLKVLNIEIKDYLNEMPKIILNETIFPKNVFKFMNLGIVKFYTHRYRNCTIIEILIELSEAC